MSSLVFFMSRAFVFYGIVPCVALVSCNALRNERQLHFIPALKAGLVLSDYILSFYLSVDCSECCWSGDQQRRKNAHCYNVPPALQQTQCYRHHRIVRSKPSSPKSARLFVQCDLNLLRFLPIIIVSECLKLTFISYFNIFNIRFIFKFKFNLVVGHVIMLFV